MSGLPNLDAPDGFELAVFARTMLGRLAEASAPITFEDNVLQKAGTSKPKTLHPIRRLGIGWKTTLASVLLLATLGSVTWVTDSWSEMGLSNEGQESYSSQPQTENADTQQNHLPALPSPPTAPVVPDIKKASPTVKSLVVKRGKSAVNNAKRAVAGYPPGQ